MNQVITSHLNKTLRGLVVASVAVLAFIVSQISGAEEKRSPRTSAIQQPVFTDTTPFVCGDPQSSPMSIASQSHGIAELRAKHGLSGKGLNAGVWEAGSIPQQQHIELQGRILFDNTIEPETTNRVGHHATHVAGLIVASGELEKGGIGVAPEASVYAFDTYDNYNEFEMATASLKNLVVSNHSYGHEIGWLNHSEDRCPLPEACLDTNVPFTQIKPNLSDSKIRACWDEIFCLPENDASYCFLNRGCDLNPSNCDLAQAIFDVSSYAFLSYSSITGDRTDRPWDFGHYSPFDTAAIDAIALSNPEHTFVYASANQRNGVAPAQGSFYCDIGSDPVDPEFSISMPRNTKIDPRPSNVTDEYGFDSMYGTALGKNVITVGASYGDAMAKDENEKRGFVQARDFSSLGPTDDGRIKPDVVALGNAVMSLTIPETCAGPICTSDNPDLEMYVGTCQADDGSSMAAPIVSGIVLLLNELSLKLTGERLTSDLAKAALIHTALTHDSDGAPAYETGWGSVQALAAGDLIAGETGKLRRDSFSEGETNRTYKGKSDGQSAPRVTLTWLDEPGTPLSMYDNDGAQIDSEPDPDQRDPMLVTDLVLTVRSPEGHITCPWKLNPDEPTDNAIREVDKPCRNGVDNVLRVDVPDEHTIKGTWSISVECRANCSTNRQYAIAIEGLEIE